MSASYCVTVNRILEIILNKNATFTNKPFYRICYVISVGFVIVLGDRAIVGENKIDVVHKDKHVHIKIIIVVLVKPSVFFYIYIFMFVDHVTVHGSDAECSKEFSKASGSKTPASLISFYTRGPQEGTNRRSNSQQ